MLLSMASHALTGFLNILEFNRQLSKRGRPRLRGGRARLVLSVSGQASTARPCTLSGQPCTPKPDFRSRFGFLTRILMCFLSHSCPNSIISFGGFRESLERRNKGRSWCFHHQTLEGFWEQISSQISSTKASFLPYELDSL